MTTVGVAVAVTVIVVCLSCPEYKYYENNLYTVLLTALTVVVGVPHGVATARTGRARVAATVENFIV